MMIGVLLGALAHAGSCTFSVDGEPVTRLDCSTGGAWRVTCPLPEARSGKVRVRLDVPGRSLEAEARVPMAEKGDMELSIMGPGGRAGAFLVERAGAGLLPGQAVGPIQLCPVVQPGVKPGSPPAELKLAITVTEHQQTGFAEEELDGGVLNRVPVYDAGVTFARGDVVVVQPPVKDVPILAGTLPLLRDDPLKGTLSVRGEGEAWNSVGWSGSLRDVLVDTGDLVVAVLDFVAPEVEVALGPGQAVALIEADLSLWLAGDPSSQLGLVGWARSDLRPTPGDFADHQEAGRTWRRADLKRAEVRVLRQGDRLRVVIAHRAAALDDPAREAIARAAVVDL